MGDCTRGDEDPALVGVLGTVEGGRGHGEDRMECVVDADTLICCSGSLVESRAPGGAAGMSVCRSVELSDGRAASPVALRPVGDSRYVNVDSLNEVSDSVSDAVDGERGIAHFNIGRFPSAVSLRSLFSESSHSDLRCSGSGGEGA